jgi:hypothetical protein
MRRKDAAGPIQKSAVDKTRVPFDTCIPTVQSIPSRMEGWSTSNWQVLRSRHWKRWVC